MSPCSVYLLSERDSPFKYTGARILVENRLSSVIHGKNECNYTCNGKESRTAVCTSHRESTINVGGGVNQI